MELSELKDLVRRMGLRENDAWTEFQRRYGGYLRSVVLSKSGKDVDDHLQSIQAHIVEGFDRGFEPFSERGFCIWLGRVAERTVWKAIDGDRKVNKTVASAHALLRNRAHRETIGSAGDEEILERVRSILGELSPRRREILDRKFWQGMSFVDIGKAMGLDRKTVASEFLSALEAIEKRLHWGEER